MRIALALKGIDVAVVPVHLRHSEQLGAAHTARNPLGQVPVLEWEVGGETRRLTQSLAIIQYLERTGPAPSVLPTSAFEAAKAWQMAELINAGIQPLQNLSVMRHLGGLGRPFGKHWIQNGLDALEAMTGDSDFLVGSRPSVAECCLIPQLYNARRFGLDPGCWPALNRIDARCASLDAFQQAHPDNQPDAGT